ncbi:hypothetical protein BASA81_016573 [Batrachochytrium salamandrivorans]|nr:hypothetical protein BASA81_016573 [Batrachochytrium salamandrivorans]
MFTEVKLGALKLSHRVVMAPLTRTRATDTFAPASTAVEYYTQRATKGGLLITEAVPISPETPYEYAPGIYTPEQEQAWKKIVDAVHDKGGLISMQMWHVGRTAHASWAENPFLKSLNRPLPSVGPSTVGLPPKLKGLDFVTKKQTPLPSPRQLTKEELTGRLVQDYVKAAEAAKRAGFDAVEIHCAHGYLIDQFLNNQVNTRTDEFGGSIENRLRLMHLVVEAVIKVFGTPERVAVRLSPTYEDSLTYYDTRDSNPTELYREAVKSLAKYGLAYLLLTEPRWTGGASNNDPTKDAMMTLPLRNTWARQVYPHKIIGAGGFTPTSAKEAIETGAYDAIAFGRWFISTPDLVRRLKEGLPLNVYDRATFYVRDDVLGYVDYPFWGQESDPKYRKVNLLEHKDIGSKL